MSNAMNLGSFVLVLASAAAVAVLPNSATAQSRTSISYHQAIGFVRPEAHGAASEPGLDARLSRSSNRIQHGVIGAVTGAMVGSGLGYAYVAMHCDNGVTCDATRAVLAGAVIGVALGVIVEYAIRSWPARP
jgi:hypothetical protein